MNIEKESEVTYDPETKTYYNKNLISKEILKEEISEAFNENKKISKKSKENSLIEAKKIEEDKDKDKSLKMTKKEFDHKISNIDKSNNNKTVLLKKEGGKKISKSKLNKFFLDLRKNQSVTQTTKALSLEELLFLLKNEENFRVPENAENFNIVLTNIRRKKIINFYERPEIMKSINFIIENLDKMQPVHISEYCVNLSKMKIDKLDIYKKLEEYILANSYKFTVRCLANIVHSFIFISKKQNILSDFQHMYRELETVFALKIKQIDPMQIDTKSINQIMIAYSKTQNFSNEFLYFLEQITLEIFDRLSPQEISNILYSFAKNKYECHTLVTKLGIISSEFFK